MVLAAIADEPIEAGEIDADRHAALEVRRAGADQRLAGLQRGEGGLVEAAVAGAEADLGETRARAHQHGKGARRYLDEERAVIAVLHQIEFSAAIGDDAGEDIEAPGRALGVGGGAQTLRELQPLH